MGKTWIIALLIFVVITFIYWKVTRDFAEKEYGEKMWKQWGTRTFYWQGAIFISSGITILILFVLKWFNVLSF